MAYFVVTFGRGPRWSPDCPRRARDGWDEHAAFMDGLVRRGVVLLGGPLGDDVDEGPALVLVAADDAQAAASAFRGDPWHGTVLVTERVTRWTLWLGEPPAPA
ncbi:hypothetical protein [Sinomonas sp. P10A9]|uniref:YCII-related domain-containing protein n=1 Tax=Sinomonas puerhi TaxID=3238584 RepID=A0AB39L1R8_9MICC